MTTIACSRREIAADTKVSLEGVGTDVCSAVKIYRANHALYGMTGADCSGQILAFEWIQNGGTVAKAGDRPFARPDGDWMIVELSRAGIALWNSLLEREALLDQHIALGSGRKAAMYCMRVLGMSPPEAVREACKVDDFSDHPIYHATLRDPNVRPWVPRKRKS